MASGRIDVHQHLIPQFYRRALDERNLTAGGWPTPAWDPAAAIAMMDRRSISTGMLSISAPGVHFGDDNEARERARAVNDYNAELVKDRPDRFGQFASVGQPDVDGAVAEAVRALDELHADGVVLMSQAGGRYLGDSALDPLWAELDARAAVVFVHPTAPAIDMMPGLPSPLLDFPFDTTRTALHMAVNGVPERFPRVRVILAHAGGFVPFVASRLAGAALFNPGTTSDGLLTALRSFYFDTALSSTITALPSLRAFALPGRVLYGSDFPFAAENWGTEFDNGLDSYPDWRTDELTEVNWGNAEALFPRLV